MNRNRRTLPATDHADHLACWCLTIGITGLIVTASTLIYAWLTMNTAGVP